MKVSSYAKVALFFIILGGAGVVFILLSADGLSQFNTVTYEAMMPDATGLSTKAKVYLAGVQVGKIRSIELEGGSARVGLELLKDIELKQDATVSRMASSILGTSILKLNPGSDSSPVLLPGGEIGVAGTGADLDQVMGSVSGILKEFQENQLKLLAISLETFNSIAGKIDARTDEELDRITRILESAALITERTDRLLASREEDIGATLHEMRLAMENIRAISGEIAAGRGNLGQTVYDDRLYSGLLSTVQETEKTVVKLQGVVDGAGEFINRANGMGLMVDSHANYGFNREAVTAGASLRLEPASGDRWYRIGVNSAPDGVSSRTVTTTTSGGVTTTEDKTETNYSFSVDAELARRIGFVTLRGGLLESTAGVGVDVQPVRWVALSGEAFHFRTGEVPNIRGTVTVYPFFNPETNNPLNWLYLQGGVYDALSADRRDFFAGGGLRFSDREIKGLAGLAVGVAGAN
jgi:phospholipid/cholesterol/gamma-HCH transport system substrate-binding protein